MKERLFQSQSALALLISLALGLTACSTSQNVIRPDRIQSDYIVAPSIKELTNRADIVAIGEPLITNETVNMARNVNDPSREDPNILIVGRVIQFRVEQYLKGNGPQEIKVVAPEAYLDARTPKTTEQIEQARQREDLVAFTANRYLVFLTPLRGFPVGYYTGVAEPWRFAASDPQSLRPETPSREALTVFQGQPLKQAIEAVESAR